MVRFLGVRSQLHQFQGLLGWGLIILLDRVLREPVGRFIDRITILLVAVTTFKIEVWLGLGCELYFTVFGARTFLVSLAESFDLNFGAFGPMVH